MSNTYTTTLSMSIGGDEPTWEGEATVSYCFDDDGEVEEATVTHIDGQPVSERERGAEEAVTLEMHIWGSESLVAQLQEDAGEYEAEAQDRRDEARAEWGMQ